MLIFPKSPKGIIIIKKRSLEIFPCASYFEVVEAVPRIQVNAFGFLVDRHDGQADVQGAVKFTPLDLFHNSNNSSSNWFWHSFFFS